MHSCRNVFGISAIAGAAFVAGLFISGATSSSVASTQDPAGQQEAGDDTMGMSAEMMEAWMRASQPGEHHQRLNVFVGEWDVAVRFRMAPGAPWEESTGTASREWVLDKRFLSEKVTATAGEMGEFNAISYLGYDNVNGQYESVWLENMATSMYSENGVYLADEKKFIFHGNHRLPTGQMQMSYSEFDVSNPDRHVITGWTIDSQGGRYKSFEGVFERRD